MMKRQFAFCQF